MDNMENFALSKFLTDLDSNDPLHVTDQQDKTATATSGEENTTNDEMMDKSVSQNAAQAGVETFRSMTSSQSSDASLQSEQTSESIATPSSGAASSSVGEISNIDLLKWTWATLFQIWTNPSQDPDTADNFRPTVMIAIQGKMWAAMNGWIRYPNEAEIELVHRSLPLTSTLWRFLIDARSELGSWHWEDTVLRPWTFTSSHAMSEGVTIFERKTEAMRDKKDRTRKCRPCADGELCKNPYHSVSETVCFHWKPWCFYHDHRDDGERRDCLDMLGAELQQVPGFQPDWITPDARSMDASPLVHKNISSINASPLIHKTKFVICEKLQHNQFDVNATKARRAASDIPSEEDDALQASARGEPRKRKAREGRQKEKTERKSSRGRHERVVHASIAPAEQSADFDNSLISPGTLPQAMPSIPPPMVPRTADNSRLPEAMPSTLPSMTPQAAGKSRLLSSMPPRAMSGGKDVADGTQAYQSSERQLQHGPAYGQHVSTYGQYVPTYKQHVPSYGEHALPPPDPRSAPPPRPIWGNAPMLAMHAPNPPPNPQYASKTGTPPHWTTPWSSRLPHRWS